jgi:hypothetical protein
MKLLRTLLYMDSTITIHISIQEKEFIVDVKHINPQINDFEKRFKDENIMFEVIEKNFGIESNQFKLSAF